MKKSIITISAILNLLFISSVSAQNLDYSVTVEPALSITTSSDKVSLNLNPLNHNFDSQNLTISVSTNNETGYKLFVNTTTTDLIENNDPNLAIKTLETAVSEKDFTTNRWGYKLNTENYQPFESGILISSSKTAIENNSSTLTFASKIDYETKAGSYALALNFQALANPHIYYIQNFTNELCSDEATDNPVTVVDVRDDNDYQVGYINGNCWMVQNLRFSGNELKKETTNIDTDRTITWGDLTAGNSYDVARYHDSGNTTYGYWYNYAGASAMTITGSNNESEQTYDICPKNWRLPTQAELNGITGKADEFSPVAGGRYSEGTLGNEKIGSWWSSTSRSSTNRNRLVWEGNELTVANYNRYRGFYVRCISSK